jgi:hypothetical protein
MFVDDQLVGEAGLEPTTPGLEDVPSRYCYVFPCVPLFALQATESVRDTWIPIERLLSFTMRSDLVWAQNRAHDGCVQVKHPRMVSEGIC